MEISGGFMKKFKILCTGGSGFIGTHLVDLLVEEGIECANIDIQRPKKIEHKPFWRYCNILDLKKLQSIFREFQPTHVVHLAARARTDGKSLDDFQDNTEGTANVLAAVKNTPSVSRFIVTSTQHVRKPGSRLPENDVDFVPYGLYGQSKVITEQLTRQVALNCIWTIIRPTTVWGPWHPFMVDGLWRIMKKGYYLHPSGRSIVRSYGYVKNVVWQIMQILQSSSCAVDKKVFYLGEEPIRQIDWLNAFSRALINRNVRIVPRFAMRALALVGDGLNLLGIDFPMQTPRYLNMITDNFVPITPTYNAFGKPPYSIDEGIAQTIAWLKNHDSFWMN